MRFLLQHGYDSTAPPEKKDAIGKLNRVCCEQYLLLTGNPVRSEADDRAKSVSC